MIRTVKNNTKKKIKPHTLFYRVCAWLHLWLGLITGIITFIVCITACIWAFEDEIKLYILEPETRISIQNKPVISPSELYKLGQQLHPDKRISSAKYQQGRAIELSVGEGRLPGIKYKIHPYTGEIISVKKGNDGDEDFFRIVLNGHRFLWLPYDIGKAVVCYSTLIFVILLITGLILWYPKKWNRSTRDKSFKIKINATAKRLNYDLHNVLGFYSLLILLAISCTGIVYGIEWYSKGLYWVTSGGKRLPESNTPKSDTLNIAKNYDNTAIMDNVWEKVLTEIPQAKGFYFSFPETTVANSTIRINVNILAGKSYHDVSYTFDRYTGKQLPKQGLNGMRFQNADFGGKLRKVNYDIHIGSILGLSGRVLAFFASLIGASLPITGFIIWRNKRKKKPKSIRVKGLKQLKPQE